VRSAEQGDEAELAEFWDTHSVTDFADQLDEVSEPVFGKQVAHGVRVPLSAEERLAVRRLADSKRLRLSVNG